MATSVEVQLAPVTARDGADTRKKENSEEAAAESGEATRVGDGDHERDGQAAALYLVPTGAEIEGSPMNVYWANYLSLAEDYILDRDFFRFVPFDKQQAYNEAEIEGECNRTGEKEAILNIYRMYYNRSITKFRKTNDSQYLKDAMEYLADFNKQLDS